MVDSDSYQAAMREAASAAWDRNWPDAIEAYEQALEAVPDDPQALAGLGLALLESQRYAEALKCYQRVSERVPSDPLPYEKMGEIYQQQADFKLGAKQFLAAGEVFLARKDLPRAIPNWRQAVVLDPDLAQAHMRLAVAYDGDSATRLQAVGEYLEVARLLQRMGQTSRAEQALQRAMTIDPIRPDVRNALNDLKQGRPIQLPQRAAELTRNQQPVVARPVISDADEADILLEAIEEERRYSPIDEAARHAMAVLADSVWAGEVPAEAQVPLVQAIDARQIGDVEGAMNLFRQAYRAGLDHPALHFNLAVLYKAAGRHDDVIESLTQTASIPEYAVASDMLLGQVYAARGDNRTAADFLLRALRTADQQLNPAQSDLEGYDRLLAGLADQPAEHLAELAQALLVYLEDTYWLTKLQAALGNYAEQGKSNYVLDLIELMIEGGRPEMAAIMERVGIYLQRDMIPLAKEEAHYAIARAPDYLPAHRRLAEILAHEGHTQEAATKLNLIANTYLIRGNADKAADLLTEAIELWPAYTEARQRVIGMLREQGRTAEALRHSAELANLHYRLMADPDTAVQVYNEALEYARQARAEPQHTIPVLKGLADIESQRLNWRKALTCYERIAEIEPTNEKVALARVELNFQLGEPTGAVEALDGYLRHCIDTGQPGQMVAILEEQVRRHPQETALRQRLAETYRQQGRTQEALTQLDALGELQLEQGRINEAVSTIRKIIEMNPPDVEGYHKLLAQLEGGSR